MDIDNFLYLQPAVLVKENNLLPLKECREIAITCLLDKSTATVLEISLINVYLLSDTLLLQFRLRLTSWEEAVLFAKIACSSSRNIVVLVVFSIPQNRGILSVYSTKEIRHREIEKPYRSIHEWRNSLKYVFFNFVGDLVEENNKYAIFVHTNVIDTLLLCYNRTSVMPVTIDQNQLLPYFEERWKMKFAVFQAIAKMRGVTYNTTSTPTDFLPLELYRLMFSYLF